MKINEFIKKKREENNLNEEYVSEKLGFSDMSYFDVEFHEDEIFLRLTFEEVEKLFRVLKVNWDDAIKFFLEGEKGIDESYPRETVNGEMKDFLKSELKVSIGVFDEKFEFNKTQIGLIKKHLGLNQVMKVSEIIGKAPSVFIGDLLRT